MNPGEQPNLQLSPGLASEHAPSAYALNGGLTGGHDVTTGIPGCPVLGGGITPVVKGRHRGKVGSPLYRDHFPVGKQVSDWSPAR